MANGNEHPAFIDPDAGIDETAPIENGEMFIFELSSESDRRSLAQWAHRILPGYDVVDLQQRTRVGDLVLNRPGSNAFEVFTRSQHAEFERVQARLAILGIVEGNVDRARAIDAWVHGDE